ncbi:MAG: alanine:cation symporter family protein [Lacrimispora sp.]
MSGAMLVFAFATIIAWYYLGRQAAVYLAESLKKRKTLYFLQRVLRGKVYTFLYLGAVFLGCLAKLETVWEFSDIWNGLMALPNILALIFLMKEVSFPK